MQEQKNTFHDDYFIIPKVSIRPEKFVFYTSFEKKHKSEITPKAKFSEDEKNELLAMGIGRIKMPESNKHKFEVSYKAKQRIKEKISWLYQLAKNQTITTHNGKVLSSFKMNFITLTLPSKQIHPTDEITKICLSGFLNECSNQLGLKNYVWRLEFQKNGNVHYHIATDTYIEYWRAKKIWNRYLEKLGYISNYSAQMSKHDFRSYYQKYHKNGEEDHDKLLERFKAGVKSEWKEPNSVDARNVTNSKNIAFYISKYITKDIKHKKDDATSQTEQSSEINPIICERENTQSNLRLWFCSRALSKLDKITIELEYVDELIDNVVNSLKDVKQYITDYCKLWFYRTSEQSNSCKRFLYEMFYRHASEMGYYS